MLVRAICLHSYHLHLFFNLQAKAACVLIDLCFGPLSPWIYTITAKSTTCIFVIASTLFHVDLAIELPEDLLVRTVPYQANLEMPVRYDVSILALKYILLALSEHMDDVLSKYKEFKHRLLFLLEMLEPFRDPALLVGLFYIMLVIQNQNSHLLHCIILEELLTTMA
ncbi:unnamed protein product [Musa acuminata subsp. malaccensis]|uniref:(wild Malaysian banana) hypothetical protein n=1 Tax=Musa acuminata subsp. malaccensis TaxID=214687 RepID=A0A8D7FNU2_MUSAM|nr:unnamed protein product [Musa acuminata subsp. malaccensis]